MRVRRYDVALDVNVMGVKHICQLAKQCPNLEVVLHVSTGKYRLWWITAALIIC
jgi:nucleoside-diphosphate-sugar epimerase